MTLRLIQPSIIFLIALAFNPLTSVAQFQDVAVPSAQGIETQHHYGLDSSTVLQSRVVETPPDVLKMFRDAGMSPREHKLTEAEKRIVDQAFAALPVLHQQVLKGHLQSISFLDDMPNTALTSSVNPDDPYTLYHITFRAAILKQNISELLTEKENTCYQKNDSTISVSIQAGNLSALIYVLLHECTHVVDGSLGLLPPAQFDVQHPGTPFSVAFTKGIWNARSVFDPAIEDSLLKINHFRSRKVFPISTAQQFYEALQKSPFVSVYSTNSFSEDLAEYLTVYHLTQKLKQPFKIVISQHNKQVFTYDPMKSNSGRSRMALMKNFYLNLMPAKS